FGWFAVRWQLGNMLAELTLPTDPGAKDIAALAVQLSPGDPMANWLSVGTRKNVFTPEGVAATAKSYEQIAGLSPNDYRWWVEVGRAREQAEEIAAAEQAFLRAVEIAPSYTYPRWQLGNFYLRQNRSEEAFAQLKKAAESYTVYREQVFSVAWDYYEKDTARLEELAGNAPSVRAGLAKFYASKERAADSLRVWNTLSAEEKVANAPIAKVIAQSFYEKRFFRQAQDFIRELEIEPEARFETIQNAGFENPFGNSQEIYFGWNVVPTEKIEIKFDPTQKREGRRSLRVSFNGYAEPTLYNIYQYVTVQPTANYRLTFLMRTENLKSGGTPAVEIYNANDDKNIITSAAFPTGTNDWQPVKLEFTAPVNAEAVGIRTVRAFCGAECPIIGVIWYDDFKLEKIK
ncbi:MAG: carbohydrate binding domain-containing protein, partial [Pyrinomonadaceae bacterium]|nr:carbohydrate binding domain-containing protein [Pyrinomonadaceae bacterium]